jgi:hypothetical protein
VEKVILLKVGDKVRLVGQLFGGRRIFGTVFRLTLSKDITYPIQVMAINPYTHEEVLVPCAASEVEAWPK